jgi:hypothetical protein
MTLDEDLSRGNPHGRARQDALKREAQAQRRSTKIRNVGLFVLSLAAAVAGLLAYVADGP